MTAAPLSLSTGGAGWNVVGMPGMKPDDFRLVHIIVVAPAPAVRHFPVSRDGISEKRCVPH
jgi:hypothetical protein